MSARNPARHFREVRKASAIRKPYEVVLIVCEGSKTEPQYFREMVHDLRLSTANIHIAGEECGSSPSSIIEYAIKRFGDEDYDKIFCVFDKDSHASFESAKDRCRSYKGSRKSRSKKSIEVVPITSNPCFEFWLILHLKDTSKPYAKTGTKSVGDIAERELRALMPKYRKGQGGVFAGLRGNLDNAINRAANLRRQGVDNPFTDIDVLVTYLRELSRR